MPNRPKGLKNSSSNVLSKYLPWLKDLNGCSLSIIRRKRAEYAKKKEMDKKQQESSDKADQEDVMIKKVLEQIKKTRPEAKNIEDIGPEKPYAEEEQKEAKGKLILHWPYI